MSNGSADHPSSVDIVNDAGRLERRLGDAIKITRSTIRLRLMRLGDTWQDALDLVLDALEAGRLAATA